MAQAASLQVVSHSVDSAGSRRPDKALQKNGHSIGMNISLNGQIGPPCDGALHNRLR